MAWSGLVDLALTDTEKSEQAGMVAPGILGGRGPQYPYGTRITLCEKELEKLKLDIANASVGDMVDMRCFGTITSLSTSDGPDGPCCRVEIQIEKISVEQERDEVE